MENEKVSNENRLELDKELKQAADKILALDKNIVASYIETGHLLQKIKDLLNHGQFEEWVRDRLKMPIRTAQIRMAMASFAEKNDLSPEQLHSLTTTSLEKLSAPSCPPKAVAEALDTIKSGTPITHKEVAKLISTAKGASVISPRMPDNEYTAIEAKVRNALAVLTDQLELYAKFFEALEPDGVVFIQVRGRSFPLAPPKDFQISAP